MTEGFCPQCTLVHVLGYYIPTQVVGIIDSILIKNFLYEKVADFEL